jgi:hypothetical protein
MGDDRDRSWKGRRTLVALGVGLLAAAIVLGAVRTRPGRFAAPGSPQPRQVPYEPRVAFDSSGSFMAFAGLEPWGASASLEAVARSWRAVAARSLQQMDEFAAPPELADRARSRVVFCKAMLAHFQGKPRQAYQILEQLRAEVQGNEALAREQLFSIIYYQGVTALRCAETENCLMCRGESACILPIAPAAVHTDPRGSRQAVGHFSEYLARFPGDLEVQWLLNVAHMTLGEYPDKVDPRFLIPLDHYLRPECDVGKFRDVSYLVGLERLNMSGGAIMDDFDNDGRLDLVVTSSDPTQSMALYHNKGDGTFEDRTEAAGLKGQLGGLYCVQTDYNNDGYLDIFIPRGAWLQHPIRPSLLRNNGNGTFTDVTQEAGLLDPVNSISATWADFDNDGWLDLFICCEKQPNRLYHNKGDGTFEEVAAKAGVQGKGLIAKGAAWIDYDNDGWPDLFLNNMDGYPQLFHNNRDGTFRDVTQAMGITGPETGFSCWAWDFDNDGWIDIFAASRSPNLAETVRGLQGQPGERQQNRLYRNLGGTRFQDVTCQAGLDLNFASMGSNFADFDGDGYLDFYLGTGDPDLGYLVPNRMFKNVGGKRFVEVTGPSGTGHLQKGHAVACGDWRRNGNVDIFIELGGAVPGDQYHNALFLNPGHGNSYLSVKLAGKKTNRAAIGARIKVVTGGANSLTVHRHVSSGSSFGANPLQQTIGLGQAEQVALLEIYWPTSGTTQVFRNVPVNQAIEVTEFAADYRKLRWTPIPLPK